MIMSKIHIKKEQLLDYEILLTKKIESVSTELMNAILKKSCIECVQIMHYRPQQWDQIILPWQNNGIHC